MRQIDTIVIHCAATRPQWMQGQTLWTKRQEIHAWHTDPKPRGRGWQDIGYHWLIDRDGAGIKGRDLDWDDDPWEHVGAHVAGHNARSIGICLLGGYGSERTDDFLDHFTAAQSRSLIAKIEELREKFRTIKSVVGHHDLDKGKACPGFRVPLWYPEARRAYYAEDAPEVAPEPVPFDMTAARAEIATLREHIGRAKMALDKLEAML